MKSQAAFHSGLVCIFLVLVATVASGQTTKTWNGSNNSDWFNPTNWIPSGVPATNDNINFTNGTINLTAPVTHNGQFNWASGTLSGNGLTIAPNGELTVSGGGTKYVQNGLTNAGVVTWTGGTVYVMNNGTATYAGVIENLAGGLWDIRCDQSLAAYFGGTNAYFRNQGTLQKSTTAGTTSVTVPLHNGGLVTVSQGTLSVNNGGTVEGNYVALAGAVVNFSGGAFSYSTPPLLSGAGAFLFSGGTLTLGSDVIPNLQLTGGVVTLGPNFQGGVITNLTLAGATLNGNYTLSGTFNAGGGVSGSLLVTNGAVLNWSGGTISSSLNVAAGGLVNWSGGTALGPVSIASNGELTVSGGGTKYVQNGLTNAGLVTWTGGTVYVMNNGTPTYAGVIENLTGGLWDIRCDQSLAAYFGGTNAYFRNQGTLQKSTTAGTTSVTVPLHNGGLVTVSQGTLNLSNGGTVEGNYVALAGAVVNFSGGAFSYSTPPLLSGAGAFLFSGGTLTLGSDVIPNLQLTGGVVTLGPNFQGGVITNLNFGGTLNGNYVVAGTLTLGNGVTGGLELLSGAVLNWSGGTISSGLQITNGAVVHWSGGNLAGNSQVQAGGLMDWSGGTALGPVTIEAGAALTLNGGGTKYVQNGLTNAGLVTWTGGTVYVMNNGSATYAGVIENLTGGLWDIRCDQSLAAYFGGTNAYFRNHGTLQKSTAAGTTSVTVPLHNGGLVTVLQGTLNLSNGGTLEGNYVAGAGAVVNFSGGAFSYSTPPLLSGAGAFLFSGGTLTLGSDVIPNLQLTGGVVTLGPNFQGGVITNLNFGGTLNGNYVVAGILTLGNGVTGGLELLSGAVLNWSGGTISSGLQITNGVVVNWSGGNLAGNSQVQAGGLVNWSGGTVVGPVSIASNGVLTVSGGGTKYVQNGLTNAGVVTWTGGTVYVMNNGTATYAGVIENLAGGLWDIRCDQSLAAYFGGTNAYFRNQGTLQKSTTAGTTSVTVPLHNAGLVTVQQGTLNLSNGGTVEGNYVAGAGAVVNFSGGAFSYSTPPLLSGAGAFLFSGGTLTLGSDVIPNLQLTGGVVTLGPNFQGGVITNLTLAGATLNGNLMVTNDGVLNWNGGTISSSLKVAAGGLVEWSGGTALGSVMIEAGAALTMSGGGTKYIQNGLTNAGVVTWTGGTVYVMNNGTPTYAGAIENLTGGLWDIRCDQSLAAYFGGTNAYFRNQGTLQKSTTAGTTSVTVPLHNGGLVTVSQGTLNLSNGGTVEGNYVAGAGAVVNFSGGAFSYSTPPLLSGAGAFLFSGGTLTLGSDVIPNLQLTGGVVTLGPNFQGGVITNLTLAGATLNGNLLVTNDGVLNWNGGNITSSLNVAAGGLVNWSGGTALGPVTIASNGVLTLSGGGTKYVQNGLTNAGLVTWTGGTVYVMNNGTPTYAGVIENLTGGLWDIRCDQSLASYFGGTSASFRNHGTLQKSTTAGTTTVSIILNNAGVMSLLTGTINFNAGGNYVQSGAILNFGLSGPGGATRMIVNGNLALDGTLTANLLNGYTPTAGNSIPLITCGTLSNSFQALNLPAAGTGLGWRVAYAANGVSLQVISNATTTAQIVGNVTDQTSSPVTNLTVFAFTTNANNTIFLSTTTDAGGNYSLAVSNGTWFVGLKNLPARGYNPVTNQVAVVNNANQTINFVLAPYTGVLNAIATSVHPPGAGTSSGDGLYAEGSSVIVTAAANTNTLPYYFSSWTENGVFQSASSTYVFPAQRNRQLVANFTLPAFTVIASNSPPAAGTVSGAGTNFFASTNVLTAQAGYGYAFTNWTENGVVIGTNPTLSTVIYSNHFIVANYVEANLSHVVTTATSPGGIAPVTGAGIFTNGQTASFSAPPTVLSPPYLYTFQRFALSNNLISSSPSFNKTFATTDHPALHYVAVYDTLNIVPQLNSTVANYPNPVPATTNLLLTFRFDRSMQTNVPPLVSLTNLGGGSQPVVGTNGHWTSTALLNDTYVTPGITLGTGMDGLNQVFISGAQDTNGYTLALTNGLSLVVDATFPVLSNVSATPLVVTAAVTWNSDEPTAGSVEYGLTTAYGATSYGGSSVTNHNITLYNLTAATTYHYRVRSADVAGNTTVSADATFTTLAAPDLLATNLNVTGDLVSGGNLTISWADTNAGPAATYAYWYDQIIVSNLTTGAQLLNTVLYYNPTVSGPIAAGAAQVRSVNFTLPNGSAGVGNLQITVIADVYNNQYEFNAGGTAENNNRATANVASVLAAYPDLQITGLTVTNAAIQSGGVVGLTWLDSNAGAGAVSNAFSDRVIVVNVTNNQTLVNTLLPYSDGVAGGGSVARQFAFTLPDGPAGAGELLITVVADAQNTIYEFNLGGTGESNNTNAIPAVAALAPYPDLIVTNVITPLTAIAGQTIQLIWSDLNQGSAPATNAWFDQVFLTSSNGIGGGQLLATFSVTNGLTAGQSLTLTQNVTLPPFVSGTNWLIVKANVAAAFYEGSLTNNAAIATNATVLDSSLQLTLSPNTISESAGSNSVLLSISRNGVLTAPLTVNLSSTLTNVYLPASVVIPAGVSSTNLYLSIADNNFSGDTVVGQVIASASGFAAPFANLTITDNDVAALTLSLSVGEIAEDAGTNAVAGLITRNTSLANPLVVSLASDRPDVLLAPASVTIPAGNAAAIFQLTPVPDGLLASARRARVTATASGFSSVSTAVDVLNTDTVQLSLALADSVVSEGAGNNATLGTVTRGVVTPLAQKVQLTRVGSPLVSVPNQVTIPANTASVNFNVGVATDGLVTGAQQAFIVANPLNQSNVPETIGEAEVQLQVLDTNGPSLNLQLAAPVISKGSNTLATLTRNTPATNILTVALSAAPTNVISFPPTVDFALGQTSVTFTVTGVLDGLQTGNRDTTLTAAAAGFNSAARSLTVSDIYLPDLVPAFVSMPTNAYTEQQITVTWQVTNLGLGATTNQNWFDYVYLATDGLGGGQALFAAKPRVQALAVGESYTNSASFYLSALPGNFWIIVEANGNRTLTELKTSNNSVFSGVPLVANAAYRAELLNANPTLAASGTPVVLQGRTFNPTNNAPMPNRSATVRVLVNETRRVFPVNSDASGNFSYTFQPLANEAGDYTATADHPSLTDPAAQVAFTLLGLAADPANISLQLLPNAPVSGTLLLTNLSSHALSGLAFTTPDLGTNLTAQFTFTNTTLPPNGVIGVDYTLESPLTRAAQMNFPATVTSTEGATRAVGMYIKLVPTLAQLVATPAYLQRGMVRGEQTVVSFTIANTGGTASGDLTVQIPSLPWLSYGSTTNIPSLPAGSNTVVTLLLNPAADLTLGLYNGNIAVFNQNVGVTIPYQFRAVSSGIGDLIVNVTDDYTYYVAGEPKVTNATVVLRDPFTGSIVAQTNSGPTGVAQFSDLTEGSYTVDVAADKHNQFRGTATIAAGTTNTLEAFLPRQLVTYQWSVVPTEIEDKYKIVLESVFETEVPVPNVVIEEPQVMVVVAEGKISQFEMKLTNHGLIAAEDVAVDAPYHPTYLITPLVQNVGRIPAKSSVTIPVTVQFRSTASGGAIAAARGAGDGPLAADGGGCSLEDINACLPKIPLRARYSYPCGGNNVSQSRSLDLSVICAGLDAQECYENLAELLASGNLLSVGCNAINAFLACAGANLTPCQQAAISTACGAALGGIAGAAGAGAGGALECLCSHLDDIPFPSFGGGSSPPPPTGGGLLPIFPTGGYYAAGNPVVTYIYIPGGNCGGASAAPTAAASVSSSGYNPASALRLAAPAKANASSGVCARVRLRINQEVVMTRSAFVGTLEIENGGLSSITGVQVTLDFRDGGGTNAATKFVTEGPVLSSLTAVNGSGELAGGATGAAVYTFIPTSEAAPDRPYTYQIGGTLRYIDDGQEVVVPLLSAPITVYPEAKLDLVYFQQRDVYGDDPFTLPVEPSEPYTLGLIVKNIGAGDAKNFEITSGQPQIIENEKGLLIDFSIIGTRVGSNAISPSLTAKLGSITAGAAKVVTWDLISSLQGKFISFEASFEHVDGLGHTNLSLINSIETHELTHAVRANRVTDDGIVDFLVNDFADPQNLPDLLYLNTGAIEPVNVVTNGSFDGPAGPGHLQVQLTTTVSDGWNYFRLPDPGPGYLLASVVRSDGKPLALTNNAWTTDRTFPSSSPGAIKENLVHLFDWAGPGQYTLTYRSTNTATPSIVQFVPVTPFTQTGAVATATIIFSEQMNLATFNYTALSLRLNGGTNLITAASGVTVAAAGGNSYTINGLAGLTGVDGNYTLTVNGEDLFDVWGNNVGDVSASISWAKGNAAPVVESITTISPNPRNTPVASLLVTFSKAINPASFTLDDIALTLDGGSDLIGAGVTITTADNTTFAVSGLGGLTGAEGGYIFTVNAASVSDGVGTTGQGSQAVAWAMITSAPHITALPPVNTNPRNIVVQNLDVTFSHPINPATFNFADLTLTRNGGPNLIGSNVIVTALSPTDYRISEISWVQGSAGAYVFTVNAAGVQDLAGNAGVGSTNISWQMVLDTPPTPTNLVITPDLGISASDGLTSTNLVTLLGSVAGTNLTVRVYDESTATDLGLASMNGTNFSAALLFAASGTHRLKVTAIDGAGNVSAAAYKQVVWDQVRPSASIGQVLTPIYAGINSVTITFTEGINPATISSANFVLTRDGTNALTPSFSLVTSNIAQLNGLSALTEDLGTYQVTANLNGVADYAGNTATNVLTMTWLRDTLNQPPILTPITNMVVTPDGGIVYRVEAFDPDGDELTYSLGADTPTNAIIVATNGLFRWRPTRANASTTRDFTVVVTDNGNPPMSTSNTFAVTVLDYLDVTLGHTNLLGGETATLPVVISSSEGVSNVQFRVAVPFGVLTNWTLVSESAQLATATLLTEASAFTINLETVPGQLIQGTQQVSRLEFTATTNSLSQFLPLQVADLAGLKPGGITYSNNVAGGGRVVVVQEYPLLEGFVLANQTRQLVIYGRPGTNYQLHVATNVIPPINWQPVTSFNQTNVLVRWPLGQDSGMFFYRLEQEP